jgi:glutamyl-tRNA reductase
LKASKFVQTGAKMNNNGIFSIIDIIEILTESLGPRKYWNALKTKIIAEGFEELSQNMGQLKMQSAIESFIWLM